MGRTRTFDPDRVVAAAREVFWQQGYEGTSLPDLERATGLNRSSLYHAFTSKKGLFDAVVKSYLADVVEPRNTALAGDAPIETYLATVIEHVRAAPTSGCLLVNAAAENAAEAGLTEVVSGYRAELTAALAAALRRTHPGLDDAAVWTQAHVLTAAIVGAHVIARVDPAAAIAAVDAVHTEYRRWSAAVCGQVRGTQ